MTYPGKRFLVVGLARSGVAAARLLHSQGARVVLNDIKTEAELSAPLRELEGCYEQAVLGCPPDGLLDGCDALVIAPGVPTRLPFMTLAKEKGIPVIGELELGARFVRCPMAAVTGTNGKTTTTALLGHILSRAGFTTHVAGNIGLALSEIALRTGPEDRLALEVSSFQCETLDAFRPRVSAILNITPDHMDRHRTLAGYVDAKCRIFMNQRDDDVVLLNADNPVTAGLAGRPRCRVAFFSRLAPVASGCCIMDDKITYIAPDGTQTPICRTAEVRLPGAHNLENALAAAAMAVCLGAPPAAIRYGLASFDGVEHRIEFVREVGGVRFINDSKGTNPDATAKAIEAMGLPTILIAGGFDKQTDFLPLIRGFPGSVQGMVVLGQTADQLLGAARQADFGPVKRVRDLREAVHAAYAMAQPGYAVLLSPACASYDMFESYEHRGRVFKQIVGEMGAGDGQAQI